MKKLTVALLAITLLICSQVVTADQGTHMLVWDPNPPADQVTGYKVWIQEGETWTHIHTVTGDVTEWRRTALPNGEYTYRLTATNATAESLPSEPATGTILGPPQPPSGCLTKP